MGHPYEEILKRRDPFSLIKDAVEQRCHNLLYIVADLIAASKLSDEEVVSYITSQIAECLLEAVFYLIDKKEVKTETRINLWGCDLRREFHLFLTVCPNNVLFGRYLLYYCDAISLYRDESGLNDKNDRRLNYVVTSLFSVLAPKTLSFRKYSIFQIEFLIMAHQCFLHVCSMEGINDVLQRSKVLVQGLTDAQSWNLMVRLVTGLGKYKEMLYCFDTLRENNQFEMLLGEFLFEKNFIFCAVF